MHGTSQGSTAAQRRRAMSLLAVALLVSHAGGAGAQAPAGIETLLTHDAGSGRRVDHGPWQRILDAYLEETRRGTRIAYDGISRPGRQQLRAYIRFLEVMPWDEINRDEQLAAWINLYNALSVQILTENKAKRRSSSYLTPPLTTRGPFAAKQVTIRGVELSAEDIRQHILRQGFRDPRIHYALHGASVGGPSLSTVAYQGEQIDQQLERAARRFVNAPGAVSKGWGGLKLSRLYEWYPEDFGGNDAAILDHIRRFANERTARKLEDRDEIDGYRYDWAVDRKVQRQPTPTGAGGYGSSPIRGS